MVPGASWGGARGVPEGSPGSQEAPGTSQGSSGSFSLGISVIQFHNVSAVIYLAKYIYIVIYIYKYKYMCRKISAVIYLL